MLIILGVISVIGLGLLYASFFVVEQQDVKIIERLGKFNRIAHAGLNFKIPLLESISGEMSLRIQQLNVEVETKTQDNVFVETQVAVQYRVREDKVKDAFYQLDDDEEQIKAYVFDTVRAQVPKMKLDTVFEEKDSIADAVKAELTETMQTFGYEIVKALVTDIQPDEKVKAAMNEINEQQRLRLAAAEKGEAEKILQVKKAEGEAESKKLQGEGIANQRKAIIEGLRESVKTFQQAIPESSANDVMQLVLMTQYFDTLKEIGANNKSTTLLLPNTPNGFNDIAAQMRDGVLTGQLAASVNQAEK